MPKILALGGGAATGTVTAPVALTNNVIPKATGAATVANSSVTDDGTSLVTTDTNIRVPTTGVYQLSTDVGLSRLGAASAALGNGSAADFTGNLKLTTVTFADATTLTTAPVIGPASATSTGIPTYSGTTGKIIQDPAGATLTANTLTLSKIGAGNAVLALSGNTSGTATFTAPAVAGTFANSVLQSNALGWQTGSGAISQLNGPTDQVFLISAGKTSSHVRLASQNNSATLDVGDDNGNYVQIFATGGLKLVHKISLYNNITMVDNGVPSELGHIDLTGQSAAIAATTIYTPTATGRFRISVYEKVTTAASVSSILGGSTGTVLTYTDGTDSVAQSISMGLDSQAGVVGLTNNANTTGTSLNGSAYIYAKTGVAIQIAVGYTSVNAGEMVFSLRATCEAL